MIAAFFARPVFAIAFGGFILCAETCLHLEEILHSPAWLDLPIYDWLAGLFLVLSGIAGRLRYRIAAWSFMCSLLTGAFLEHLAGWSAPPQADEWISGRAFISVLGVLIMLSMCGVAATLANDRDAR